MLKNLSIKYKAYLLVAIGVVTAVLLLVITTIGLSTIKSKLDELVLSTNVERYAYLTILEEKNYLLNANASITNTKLAADAFERAKEDVETINGTLDKIDATSNSPSLLDKSKIARSGTSEYKDLYYKGVDLLLNIGKETQKLEKEGELATLQAQEYVLEKRKQLDNKLDATLVKKTNIATDIWKLTYVIRADEKRYMLNPDPVVFERMKKDFAIMLEHLDSLKKMASDTQEQDKITVFYSAAKSYESAAYHWVDLNKDLMTTVLPKMKSLGDTVVKQAMEAAENAQSNMVNERDSIVTTLSIIAVVAIILGLLLGYVVVNVIMRAVSNAKKVAVDISNGNLSSNIIIESQDEMGELLTAMKSMQNTLNDFVAEQNLISEKHNAGFISHKMAADKFKGIYAKMAHDINHLVQSHIDVKMNVIKIVSEYARGNFEHEMVRLPNEKKKVTDAVDGVKTALLKISKEIETLSEAGAHGDFSKRTNLSEFEFMFKDMLTHLNDLMATSEEAFGDVLRISNALAQGDLTQEITTQYPAGTFNDTKNALNGTVENLKALVAEIKESTDTINTASQEIAAGNNDLSQRTEQQAASLEETAASMQELTSTVQANSENATFANELAMSSSDIARRGVNVVNQVVATMEDINESSRKVVDIITVIDGIAFQTNILALNAAVEAARAGDQGRGFAVVASEVRSLAQRAASAAGEIKGLISDSVEKVEDGTNLVARAGQTMEEIVNSIENVSKTINAITSASVEQNAGIQQVNQAISSMDDVTQQNAALVEQAAAAAESLEDQARHLTATMNNFKMSNQQQIRSVAPVMKTHQPSASPTPKPVVAKAAPVAKATPVPIPAPAPQVVTEKIDIDLDGALKKHADWKVKLRTAIVNKEKLDAETISKDNCCDFGKWLYSEDSHSKVSHLDSYKMCLKNHAEFHKAAGAIAHEINAKNFDEASNMLNDSNGAFITTSGEVGKAIMKLKKDTAEKIAPASKKVVEATTLSDDWEEF